MTPAVCAVLGVQSATILVREAFVRRFANAKALGSYAGLTATPYNSGGVEREQGIGKAGNRRLRTVMVELAWLWQRYQPGAAQAAWFRERTGSTGRRVRKVMVVALARKLLIALWRFAVDGVVPEGATMKPAVYKFRDRAALRLQSRPVTEGTSPLSGVVLQCRLHRVVPFLWSSPVPNAGQWLGIIPPDVRLAGRPCRKRAHLGSQIRKPLTEESSCEAGHMHASDTIKITLDILQGGSRPHMSGRRSDHSADAVAGERVPRQHCVHYTGRSLPRKPIMRRSSIDRADNRALGKRQSAAQHETARFAQYPVSQCVVRSNDHRPSIEQCQKGLDEHARLDNGI